MDMWQWYVRRGRSSRSMYVLEYVVPFVLASIAARWADGSLDLPQVAMVADNGRFLLEPAGFLEQMVGVAFLVPGLTALVTRLHDCGKSAWWLLLGLIPWYIGPGLLLIASLCFRGDRRSNDYGPPPAALRRPRLPAMRRRRVPDDHGVPASR